MEEYAYGPRGERIADSADALRVGSRELRYDRSGQLVLAGRMRLRYDQAGRLAAMEGPRGATHLVYGDNGGLEAAHLPNGLVLEYLTDGMGRPLEKRIGGRVVERFHWLDKVRLGFWEDLAGGRTVEFAYGRGRVPHAARLEQGGQIIELVLGADQVGTVKAIATSDGHLIQHIAYDSFGNVLDLQGEELGLPIGFAGGVRDRHLGLVRFGHRDYDPAIGRFTAPDPLGDTGGDHDLWEYCVDDPVSRIDPEGLFAFALPLLFMGGQALAGGIAAAGLYGASEVVGDPEITAKVGDKEIKGKLSKITAGTAAAAAGATGLAGAGAMAAPEAASMAAPHVAQGLATGAAAVSEAAKDPRFQEAASKAGEFLAGTLPTPPADNLPGQAGFLARWGWDELHNMRKK